MEDFKNVLQHEYLRRVSKNKNYSLRAFALHLNIHHATLSTLLSGKRKITKKTVLSLSRALGLKPNEISQYLNGETAKKKVEDKAFLLQNDVFSLMSDWYFDAILELALVPKFRMEPKVIALALDISVVQASMAIETLERLGLLKRNGKGKLSLSFQNTTNILDPDQTTSAQKNYQRTILEKSLSALDVVDRKKRDHTSTTMAINAKDLPKAKELIKKFRNDLNAYMQRDLSSR